MTFLGETEHFSGKNGALRWSILVGKQKHNVQSLQMWHPIVNNAALIDLCCSFEIVNADMTDWKGTKTFKTDF